MAAKSELVEDNIQDILYVNKYDYRGYKMSYLVKRLHTMGKELIICPDCKGIMRNACISNNDNTKCETCIFKFSSTKVIPVRQVRSVVDRLMIKCPLLRECDWEGELSEAEDHLSKCEQFLLTCPLNCNEVMPRGKINDHMKEECPMRKVLCTYCKIGTILAEDLTKHHESCAKYIVTCNLCTKEMERCELTNHHNTTCELFVLNCSHAKHGCEEELERRNLEEHVRNHCLWRNVKCEFCDVDIFSKDLTDHHETCPNYNILCPLCAEEMERCELDDHHNTTCELFEINCPFSKYGCEEKIKRKDVTAHKNEFLIEHQNMIVTDLEMFKEEMGKENMQLKQELSMVRDVMKLMKRLYKVDLIYNMNRLSYGTQGRGLYLDDCECQIFLKKRSVNYDVFLNLYMLRCDYPSWDTDYPIYITECRLVITREDGTIRDYFNSLSLKYRVEPKRVGCANFS